MSINKHSRKTAAVGGRGIKALFYRCTSVKTEKVPILMKFPTLSPHTCPMGSLLDVTCPGSVGNFIYSGKYLVKTEHAGRRVLK